MDNFRMSVRAEGQDNLARAMELAFSMNAPGRKATGFLMLDNDLVMVLFWHSDGCKNKGYVRFPAPRDAAEAAEFVGQWVFHEDTTRAEYPHDFTDADVGHGFHLWVDEWCTVKYPGDNPDFRKFLNVGRGDGLTYSICAISPIYSWHGK